MTIKKLRIATRTSPLALWQTNFVTEELKKFFPDLAVELVGIITTADKHLSTPLAKIGGKGLFVKELENALLENRADIAVHSVKDMPMTLPRGLKLGAVCKRGDPRDVLVAVNYSSLSSLPPKARVGTSSLRRTTQLLAKRSDLQIKNLRGNIGTRLTKLANKEFEAIILAAAGLSRLKETSEIKQYFEVDTMLPAAGQGAIGIECRDCDDSILAIISALEDRETRMCIVAERTLNYHLGGSCQVPIAAFAQITEDVLTLRALVGNLEGTQLLTSSSTSKATPDDAIKLGNMVAEDLKKQGAQKILNDIISTNHD